MILRRGIYAQKSDSETVLVPGDGTTNWVDMVGMTGTLGKIVPSSGLGGWGLHGGSFGVVPSNTEMTLSFNFIDRFGGVSGFFMSGFSTVNSDANYPSIGHCIYLQNPDGRNRLIIYESGVEKLNLGNNSYIVGSTLEIKRSASGVVTYYQNSTLLYTSLVNINTSLVYDCSSYTDLGAENLKITY